VAGLENKLEALEGEKNKQLLELQSEITDLMKHLEFQSAIKNTTESVKEVHIFFSFPSLVRFFLSNFLCTSFP